MQHLDRRPRRILATSALPYANGHIHLGHLVEYIQTDIFVRYHKLRGEQAIYLCADDTHGTAIMIRARTEGRSEQELIADMKEAHVADFADFQIEFDHYGSTDSPANQRRCSEIWQSLRTRGLITTRNVQQLYDPLAGVFLADRFVRGTCPRCKAADQYGDSCEQCGGAYSPADLIDPVSTLSGAQPEVRSADHLFVRLESLHSFLTEWTQSSGALDPPIANYLAGHFLNEPLRDWDISRPAPYFGFEIPDAPGHYWYVWFDAPIGYLAATTEWCAVSGESFESWWHRGQTEQPAAEIHHFIGKDITYFHTLFWPSMLEVAGLALPTRVRVHGFLTVNGQKMSKSRGTFLLARTYLDHLDPGMLRYYYATKLSGGIDDIDLNLEEFTAKVNADLVGKVVNLASRTARWLEATGLSATYPDDGGLFAEAAADGEAIAAAFEACDCARAMRIIMVAADRANLYVDTQQPWKLAKAGPGSAAQLQDVATVAINLFRQIAVYLSPVLPVFSNQVGALIGGAIRSWDESQTPLAGISSGVFTPLMRRVEAGQVAALISQSLIETGTQAQPQGVQSMDPQTSLETPSTPPLHIPPPADLGAALTAEPLAPECTIDDFSKVDLRVARIVAAEEVAEAKKLLRLTISLGGETTRTIFAGIKGFHTPESLVGRLVVVVANLAPRQMKFGLSEGMVAAASGAGATGVYLLSPDSGALPGMRLH
ncbi:MAG: methionine--tRNA ligase [Planctomycetota bacterium]|nr:MAG: methionine--tRNA ligase [Planctomycetota bacterium]